MKRIFTADLHIHEYSTDTEITQEGTSRKLEELLNAIKQMCDYAVENNILEIIIGGDLIHHNNIVHARAFSKFKKLLLSYKNISFVAYCGNHEFGKANGTDNALDLLEDKNIKIIRESTVLGNMTFIPHSANLFDEISNAKPNDILLSHFALSEAKTDSGLCVDSKFNLKCLKKFKMVLIGDYHTPQNIEKKWKDGGSTMVYYPGSPIPFTRAEIEDKRFLVFDNKTMAVESVPIIGYRKYYNIEINDNTDIKNTVDEIKRLKTLGHYVVVRKNIKDTPKEMESLMESVIYVDEYEDDCINRGICSTQSDGDQFVKYMDIMKIPEKQRPEFLNVLMSAVEKRKTIQ